MLFHSQGTVAVCRALVWMKHPLCTPGLEMHHLPNCPEVQSLITLFADLKLNPCFQVCIDVFCSISAFSSDK